MVYLEVQKQMIVLRKKSKAIQKKIPIFDKQEQICKEFEQFDTSPQIKIDYKKLPVKQDLTIEAQLKLFKTDQGVKERQELTFEKVQEFQIIQEASSEEDKEKSEMEVSVEDSPLLKKEQLYHHKKSGSFKSFKEKKKKDEKPFPFTKSYSFKPRSREESQDQQNTPEKSMKTLNQIENIDSPSIQQDVNSRGQISSYNGFTLGAESINLALDQPMIMMGSITKKSETLFKLRKSKKDTKDFWKKRQKKKSIKVLPEPEEKPQKKGEFKIHKLQKRNPKKFPLPHSQFISEKQLKFKTKLEDKSSFEENQKLEMTHQNIESKSKAIKIIVSPPQPKQLLKQRKIIKLAPKLEKMFESQILIEKEKIKKKNGKKHNYVKKVSFPDEKTFFEASNITQDNTQNNNKYPISQQEMYRVTTSPEESISTNSIRGKKGFLAVNQVEKSIGSNSLKNIYSSEQESDQRSLHTFGVKEQNIIKDQYKIINRKKQKIIPQEDSEGEQTFGTPIIDRRNIIIARKQTPMLFGQKSQEQLKNLNKQSDESEILANFGNQEEIKAKKEKHLKKRRGFFKKIKKKGERNIKKSNKKIVQNSDFNDNPQSQQNILENLNPFTSKVAEDHNDLQRVKFKQQHEKIKKDLQETKERRKRFKRTNSFNLQSEANLKKKRNVFKNSKKKMKKVKSSRNLLENQTTGSYSEVSQQTITTVNSANSIDSQDQQKDDESDKLTPYQDPREHLHKSQEIISSSKNYKFKKSIFSRYKKPDKNSSTDINDIDKTNQSQSGQSSNNHSDSNLQICLNSIFGSKITSSISLANPTTTRKKKGDLGLTFTKHKSVPKIESNFSSNDSETSKESFESQELQKSQEIKLMKNPRLDTIQEIESMKNETTDKEDEKVIRVVEIKYTHNQKLVDDCMKIQLLRIQKLAKPQTLQQQSRYYMQEETVNIAQSLFENSRTRTQSSDLSDKYEQSGNNSDFFDDDKYSFQQQQSDNSQVNGQNDSQSQNSNISSDGWNNNDCSEDSQASEKDLIPKQTIIEQNSQEEEKVDLKDSQQSKEEQKETLEDRQKIEEKTEIKMKKIGSLENIEVKNSHRKEDISTIFPKMAKVVISPHRKRSQDYSTIAVNDGNFIQEIRERILSSEIQLEITKQVYLRELQNQNQIVIAQKGEMESNDIESVQITESQILFEIKEVKKKKVKREKSGKKMNSSQSFEETMMKVKKQSTRSHNSLQDLHQIPETSNSSTNLDEINTSEVNDQGKLQYIKKTMVSKFKNSYCQTDLIQKDTLEVEDESIRQICGSQTTLGPNSNHKIKITPTQLIINTNDKRKKLSQRNIESYKSFQSSSSSLQVPHKKPHKFSFNPEDNHISEEVTPPESQKKVKINFFSEVNIFNSDQSLLTISRPINIGDTQNQISDADELQPETPQLFGSKRNLHYVKKTTLEKIPSVPNIKVLQNNIPKSEQSSSSQISDDSLPYQSNKVNLENVKKTILEGRGPQKNNPQVFFSSSEGDESLIDYKHVVEKRKKMSKNLIHLPGKKKLMGYTEKGRNEKEDQQYIYEFDNQNSQLQNMNKQNSSMKPIPGIQNIMNKTRSVSCISIKNKQKEHFVYIVSKKVDTDPTKTTPKRPTNEIPFNSQTPQRKLTDEPKRGSHPKLSQFQKLNKCHRHKSVSFKESDIVRKQMKKAWSKSGNWLSLRQERNRKLKNDCPLPQMTDPTHNMGKLEYNKLTNVMTKKFSFQNLDEELKICEEDEKKLEKKEIKIPDFAEVIKNIQIPEMPSDQETENIQIEKGVGGGEELSKSQIQSGVQQFMQQCMKELGLINEGLTLLRQSSETRRDDSSQFSTVNQKAKDKKEIFTFQVMPSLKSSKSIASLRLVGQSPTFKPTDEVIHEQEEESHKTPSLQKIPKVKSKIPQFKLSLSKIQCGRKINKTIPVVKLPERLSAYKEKSLIEEKKHLVMNQMKQLDSIYLNLLKQEKSLKISTKSELNQISQPPPQKVINTAKGYEKSKSQIIRKMTVSPKLRSHFDFSIDQQMSILNLKKLKSVPMHSFYARKLDIGYQPVKQNKNLQNYFCLLCNNGFLNSHLSQITQSNSSMNSKIEGTFEIISKFNSRLKGKQSASLFKKHDKSSQRF